MRRYRSGERLSHAMHQDGHALVTALVSLSMYDEEYQGGLYVSNGGGSGGVTRQFLRLDAGDVILHQPYLYHGVQVLDASDGPSKTERWS